MEKLIRLDATVSTAEWMAAMQSALDAFPEEPCILIEETVAAAAHPQMDFIAFYAKTGTDITGLGVMALFAAADGLEAASRVVVA